MNDTQATRGVLCALVTAMMLLVTACSGGSSDTEELAKAGNNGGCPPKPSSGLSAIGRAGGLEALEKYSKWQRSLPPKTCAGSLASYIPDLPEGYGLPPSTQPPVMTDERVYLRYVKMPEPGEGQAIETMNIAFEPQFEFEIAKMTPEQSQTLKDWFSNNPKSYSEYQVENRLFYATGGGALYMPGHKLMGGIATILDNDILIKFTMPNMYSDKKVAQPVAQLFHQIASDNGQ